jgi:hypothetical protein
MRAACHDFGMEGRSGGMRGGWNDEKWGMRNAKCGMGPLEAGLGGVGAGGVLREVGRRESTHFCGIFFDPAAALDCHSEKLIKPVRLILQK